LAHKLVRLEDFDEPWSAFTGGRLTLTPKGHSFAARENELPVVVEITGQKLTF